MRQGVYKDIERREHQQSTLVDKGSEQQKLVNLQMIEQQIRLEKSLNNKANKSN